MILYEYCSKWLLYELPLYEYSDSNTTHIGRQQELYRHWIIAGRLTRFILLGVGLFTSRKEIAPQEKGFHWEGTTRVFNKREASSGKQNASMVTAINITQCPDRTDDAFGATMGKGQEIARDCFLETGEVGFPFLS